MAPSVVIVGAGPRATGVLERLCASAPEFDPQDGVDVHLVDPYPPGAGRIWRYDQSSLLWMNSMAADVTMFTDDSVQIDGPVVPGPSLYEWARALRDGELDGEQVPEGPVGDELRALGPATFPTRRLQSFYLDWTYRHVVDECPPQVTVHLHATHAVGLREADAARPQHVLLADGEELPADVLVLASGHLDAHPTDDEIALVDHAEAYGLRYFPPEQTTDSELDRIPAGETVIARGMGLAFIDLVVLLFEGRGGRFVASDDPGDAGGLRYEASGQEPYLHVGSGRGVPYHTKTEYTLRGPRPPLPRFLGPAEITALVERGGVDLRRDVWPLMAKEIGWAYYHELFHGHPDRVVGTWDAFDERYAALDWYSTGCEALIAETVPAVDDHLDFEKIDRPLDDVRVTDVDALQPVLRSYIADDLTRHVDPHYTAELGAFVGLLSVFGQVAELAGSSALTARSRAKDLVWWQNLFSSLASGPPGPRVRQLLALSRAGFVRFLGAGLAVEAVDPGDAGERSDGSWSPGGFRATSSCLDGVSVEARTLVEARLATPSVSRSVDPMLAALHASSQLDEEILRERTENRDACCSAVRSADAATAHAGGAVVLHNTGLVRVRTSDFRVVRADGTPSPDRFAIGPHTNVRIPGAFTRPNTNALSFRANDAVARAVLGELAGRSAGLRAS